VDGADVYWSTGNGSNNTGSVMTMPLAGGAPATLASGQFNPRAIAVDAASVYWTALASAAVMQVALGGGTPSTLASSMSPGLAVDATSVYYVDEIVGTVMKVPIGGGTPIVLASGQSSPHCIALDATSVYWTNLGTSSNHFQDGAVMKLSAK